MSDADLNYCLAEYKVKGDRTDDVMAKHDKADSQAK